MSRLSELIAELCPDGVEYKALCAVLVSLPKGTLARGQLLSDGLYPVMNSGRDFYGWYDSKNNSGNAITIAARGEYAGYVNYIKRDFWAGGLCYPYRSANEDYALTKYVYHVLKNDEQHMMDSLVVRGSIPALNKKDLEKLRIPVPPIEVQREIVRILNSFQELDDALTTEIKARRKQYAHYRDELLKFERERVEYKKLVAVADVLYGAAFRSALFNTDGDGLPVIRIRDVLRGYSETFYSGEYEQKYVIGDGDMLLGMDGNFNLRLWSGGKALLNQRVCRISSKDDAAVLNGFLRYWLQPVFKSYEGNISRTTVAHMSARVINGIRIPVPPIEVQREIVRILNSFQDHIDTMRSEREARRKQFEHYRDRLLAFLEKAA
ncbi:MAG: restriction endonuclease subunit S [Eggerthellaceae bacterium]|nr:restriction endonuclease subunit S [Eggerthellaceae bacterium]